MYWMQYLDKIQKKNNTKEIRNLWYKYPWVTQNRASKP